ncbi:hypothetical protein ABZ478_34910 [Streptomyces sp. NPDC005706]
MVSHTAVVGVVGERLTSTGITAEVTLTHADGGEVSLAAVPDPVLGGDSS